MLPSPARPRLLPMDVITSAHLERFLTNAIAALGYSGVVQATPTSILFAFQEMPTSVQRLQFVQLPACGRDLDKLARLGELTLALERGMQMLR